MLDFCIIVCNSFVWLKTFVKKYDFSCKKIVDIKIVCEKICTKNYWKNYVKKVYVKICT